MQCILEIFSQRPTGDQEEGSMYLYCVPFNIIMYDRSWCSDPPPDPREITFATDVYDDLWSLHAGHEDM